MRARKTPDRGTTRRAGICERALSYGQVHAAWTWWRDVRVRVRACMYMYVHALSFVEWPVWLDSR